MKIVVLDGYTLNPGDLSWAGLEALGECTVYDRTRPDQLLERALGARVLLTNKVVLDTGVMTNLPDLKYIGVLATGYNVVDVGAAAARGIVVTNVPAYGTDSVAQHVFALLLEIVSGVSIHSRAVQEGEWSRCPDFSLRKVPMVELAGLTMGIVGFGAIGRAVARIASAFGMRVIVATRTRRKEDPVVHVGLDKVFEESDVVSLHCPLTPETERLVSGDRLALMKRSAILINTARGPLIDEVALANALNAGRLAGAALDVLSSEPPAPDSPLPGARNCLITPHVAWATLAARRRLLDTVTDNVRAWMEGRPENVVS